MILIYTIEYLQTVDGIGGIEMIKLISILNSLTDRFVYLQPPLERI